VSGPSAALPQPPRAASNNENSRTKFQNVRADSSADCVRRVLPAGVFYCDDSASNGRRTACMISGSHFGSGQITVWGFVRSGFCV
jgi:hypothetical protein